jgi:AhpD family alkylhydroperoxidase
MGRITPSVDAMTATATYVTVPVRLDVETHAAGFSKAMAHLDNAATRELDAAGIEPALRDLLRLRASQINGCAYCVDLHHHDARAAGESEQRVAAVAVWRESPFFTPRERAALAFAESVTRVAQTHVPHEDYEAVAQHFSAHEIGALLALLVTINAWNALSVASRAWTPKLHED